ncbi:ATP-binding protein [Nonomuraea sp. SYSU D8015]|uniref:ATP-binding protein n=1 Tax=Nonomuraea sp. SYSU D8015 TaxID=2593644 RepID=UPI00166133C8|nr:ATP-binding protein [Nonomuraea sp. SYSU D8015]
MLPIDYAWRWETAQIPHECRGRGFDDWKIHNPSSEQAIATCAKFAADFDQHYGRTSTDRSRVGKGILLIGSHGTGKTTLACMTASEVHWTHDNTILYYKASRMLSDMRAVVAGTAGPKIAKRIKRLRTVGLLVIDDVGKEYRTESGYVGSQITDLIRGRYEDGLPTVASTNEKLEKWDEMYDASMSSFAHQAFTIIHLAGKDMRRA